MGKRLREGREGEETAWIMCFWWVRKVVRDGRKKGRKMGRGR